MQLGVVLPAAGRARRFGSNENKIWAKLGGRTVLERTLTAFESHPDVVCIILVAGEEEIDRVTNASLSFRKVFAVVAGGKTRTDSVRNGLDALPPQIDAVLVHDAARPLVSHALISHIVEATVLHGAAVPGLPLSDTVKRIDGQGNVLATIPRTASIVGQRVSGLTAVQTPQGAQVPILKQAYAEFDFSKNEPTDEASLIEAMGAKVVVVPGELANIKITRQEDITLAESYLAARELPEMRTGFGYDVHAFAPIESGRKLVLGGVEIAHDRGLEGHSDADVLLHAICDALLGAVALGDIGIHFPNTDLRFSGISSLKLLEEVRRLVTGAGWQIVNVDAAAVAESPKIMPHRYAMQAAISSALEIEPGRVSVKATTNEGLGFVGRKEGISCWAVATVRERR